MKLTKIINIQVLGVAGVLATALCLPAIAAESPSFDCGKVQACSIEEMV